MSIYLQTMRRSAILAVVLASGIHVAGHAEEAPRAISFDDQVQPILASHCLTCHGNDRAEGGLRLTDRSKAMAELDSGAHAIVAGSPEGSELIARISADDAELRMPPGGSSLSETEIDVLRTWIAQGAKWELHWAYRPVVRPEPPLVRQRSWPINSVDRFVLSELEQRDIPPSPEADRRVLIKRLYLDLLGLLPQPAEVDAFVADSHPDAYEHLVDRLLASPHYGERWGRHWLDQARYADSDGYEADAPRPDAWRYRDWVIDAVNRDMPFDRFTIEQLAGDLLPDATPLTRLATAFHRQTLTNAEGGVDQEQFRTEAVFDRVETTGTVWLGLTVGCARCHSHKYDQISHQEYYQLFAFFNNADEAVADVPIENRVESVSEPMMQVRVLSERTSHLRPTHLLHRGEFLQPIEEVVPSTLRILPAIVPRDAKHVADRLDLARWIVSADNPLTPRVAANDLWTHLFGRGLVRTNNDFGVRADRPTHPELLDWLAAEYVSKGWSRKAMIKLIVMSGAYRQSSDHRRELADIDPDNRWLYRQNRLRVEGEVIRDISLEAGGLLCEKVGGPSVFPPMPPEVAALSYAGNFKWETSPGYDRYRRGMYTFFKRTAPDPNLTTFDCPTANLTCVARERSITPLQALTTLNNEVFVEAAQGLARRVVNKPDMTTADRLQVAWEMCTCRRPNATEAETFLGMWTAYREYYQQHPDDAHAIVGDSMPDETTVADFAAWVATARMLLNLDEFLTRG